MIADLKIARGLDYYTGSVYETFLVVALNAASASTMISGLPFEGPVSGVRLALIDGQWVAFPRWSERERAVFEIVVAGRVFRFHDPVALPPG